MKIQLNMPKNDSILEFSIGGFLYTIDTSNQDVAIIKEENSIECEDCNGK